MSGGSRILQNATMGIYSRTIHLLEMFREYADGRSKDLL
jgi:hypothetical protein